MIILEDILNFFRSIKNGISKKLHKGIASHNIRSEMQEVEIKLTARNREQLNQAYHYFQSQGTNINLVIENDPTSEGTWIASGTLYI